MTQHQAILFYGSSPGTGKSTLSSFLFEQLSRHQIPVLWVYEDDVLSLPYFAEFVADILSGNPKMIESLLRATRALVQKCVSSNATAITDSIYPCINWLVATNLYSHAELGAISAELDQLLRPLNPLVVFLDADPYIALQRAIEQRGEAWFQGLLQALNGYAINREHPLQTLEEAAAYFRMCAALTLELLQEWSCDLLLIDAVQTPVAQVKATVLAHLGLDEIEGQRRIAADEISLYVGTYEARGATPITNPLVITQEGDTLWVNTYWPNGCPLLAEGDGQFRLENTSHRIHFEVEPDGAVVVLTYTMGGNEYEYRKIMQITSIRE